MSKPSSVQTPVTEYIVNLSILCHDKVLLQRIIDDLRSAVGADAELLFSGDASGTYGDCFAKHLKTAATFTAKPRAKAEAQTNFSFK